MMPYLQKQIYDQMVRTIVFDTETTGLPMNRYLDALHSPGIWPDIVSICWWVYEGKELVKKENHIIYPDKWEIPESSIKIHGITYMKAQTDGVPLGTVLADFRADLTGVDHIIAHNLMFDKNVVFNAYKWRLGQDPTLFWPMNAEFCSGERSKAELKMPARYPKPGDLYKMPRLDELYEHTFHTPAPSGAHNAERDVDVLQQIVWARWPSMNMG